LEVGGCDLSAATSCGVLVIRVMGVLPGGQGFRDLAAEVRGLVDAAAPRAVLADLSGVTRWATLCDAAMAAVERPADAGGPPWALLVHPRDLAYGSRFCEVNRIAFGDLEVFTSREAAQAWLEACLC